MAYNVFHDIPSPPSATEVVRFRTIWEELAIQDWTGGPVEIRVQVLRDTDKGHYYLHRSAVFNRMPEISFPGFHYINDIIGLPRSLGESLEKISASKGTPDKASAEIELAECNLLFVVAAEIVRIGKKVQTAEHKLTGVLSSDLTELHSVLRIGAYRSVMALCGRCLEVALKVGLDLRNVRYGDDWMVGKLLQTYEENGIYLDPTLKNQLNILNSYRIAGVHIKTDQKVPSQQQVLSLVLLLCDCLTRSLLLPEE